ncbi:MAG: hypothetical protein JXR96_25400 [Deltaproteobacteria bacterium]|nr:hypothetical protein [Deltaproteobacteria bacterium]
MSGYESLPPPPGPDGQTALSRRATIALVLGIVSVLLSWLPLVGLILAVVAVVLSARFIRAANRSGGRLAGKRRAIGGLSTGIVGIVFSLISLICWIFVFVLLGSFEGRFF